MASGPEAFPGGYPLGFMPRRSVVDPVTGQPVVTSAPTGAVRQRAGLLPIGRDDSGALVPAVPQGVFDAIDAARFPGQVLRGEKQTFDPATGHVSDEAIGAATGLAGLAMTGGLGGAAADGVALGAGPVRRLSYDSPLSGVRRVSQAQVERELADRSTQATTMAADPARAPYAPLFQQEADALTALMPKFGQESFPRGRPFKPYPTLDAGDRFTVRMQPQGDAARTYRIHERGTDGGLSEPIGSAAMSLRPDGRWETSMLEVSPEHRGKGAASALYEAIERHNGVEMTPSGTLLPDGYAFWKARSPEKVRYHQDTGESLLSPRRLTEMLDEPGITPAERASVQTLLDRVPPEGKTPEALAKQFVIPGSIAAGAGAAALAQPDEARAATPNAQDKPMSAGPAFGLPTDMSPEDLARLFGRVPLGAPQSFAGTSGTVVAPEATAPAPLSLNVSPRATPAPAATAVDRGGPVLPDFQPADLPARTADMPAPGAVPTSGNFPGLPAAPARTPLSLAPPAPAAPVAKDEGLDLGGALKNFQANGGGDLLVGLGTGLMSTRGFGNGLAAGFQNAQKAEQQRAVTGLANAELGLKQRKLAQETQALGGNAAIIKRAFPNLSDAEAVAAGSNSGQVTEALKILRDPNHGRDIKADSSGVNRFTDTGKPIFADDEGKADWQQAKTPDGGTILYSKSDPSKTQVLIPGQPVRPATAEERATFGIPSNIPVKMTPTGPQAIGGGGTSVNVDLGKKANQGLDELTNAKISESYDKSQGAIGTLKAISRQKQAIDGGMITGWGADYQTQARSLLAKVLGLDPSTVVNSETFDAAASQKGAELAKAISQAGHTTNMDLQLGKTIAGGDRSKIEQSIRNAIEAQEQLARDTIGHHNEFLGKYAKVAPDTADRLGVFRVDTPETYQYRPTPAAPPDRSAVEAELRRRKVIK